MLTVMLFIKMLFRQWYKKCILLAFLSLCAFVTIKLWKSSMLDGLQLQVTKLSSQDKIQILHEDEKVHKKNTNSQIMPQAPKFSQFYTCPACFGSSMCTELDVGSLIFHGEMSSTSNTGRLWRKGVLQNERVLIGTLSADEWNKFDEFVCQNSSQLIPCDVSAAVRKTILATDEMLSVESVRNTYQLLDVPRSEVALPICATSRLVEELQKTFDDDGDGYLSKEEQILLFTSILMHPGYVAMKFQAKTGMNMPIPNLRGSCGRSLILEGGFTPLKEFLQESFDVRAGLAVQVLQVVEDFEDEDPHWYFLHTEFSYDNLMVTNDGEVVVMDLDGLVLLDKSLFPPGFRRLQPTKELCNEVCFQKVTQEMLYSTNTSIMCSQVSQYSQLMYAIVCKQILSNINEHKAEGFFNFDGHRIHKKSEHPGLLHTMPEKDKENIEDLLRECVQETSPGGRRKATEELREILENHVNRDDELEENNIDAAAFEIRKKENEDDYNDAEEETDDYMDNKI